MADVLSMAGAAQRAAFRQALALAPIARQRDAVSMLNAPPPPASYADASARVASVIRYLVHDAYRVGDEHPSVEETS